MKKNLVLIMLISLAVWSCSNNEVTETYEQVIPVKVVKSQLKTFKPIMEFVGTLMPGQETNLGAILPGRVEEIYYNEGDEVEKGTLLVELSGELLAQAEIEYKTYEKDYLRMKRLFEKGSIPAIDYDHVKAQYEAKYERYKLLKKNTQIRAPFSGVIAQHLVNKGENYMLIPALEMGYSHAPGVIRLMQIDPVKVCIEVNEEILTTIRTGMIAEVLFDAVAEKTFTGKITLIQPFIDQMSHTSQVEITIANPNRILKPGMFCRVKIAQRSQQAVFVPLQSIIRLSGTARNYVISLESNKPKRVEIEKLYTIDNEVAVKGINEDIFVITSGKSRVNEDSKIKIIED